jgi:hypothetical protein
LCEKTKLPLERLARRSLYVGWGTWRVTLLRLAAIHHGTTAGSAKGGEQGPEDADPVCERRGENVRICHRGATCRWATGFGLPDARSFSRTALGCGILLPAVYMPPSQSCSWCASMVRVGGRWSVVCVVGVRSPLVSLLPCSLAEFGRFCRLVHPSFRSK